MTRPFLVADSTPARGSEWDNVSGELILAEGDVIQLRNCPPFRVCGYLGAGTNGNVFLVRDDNSREFAMKISRSHPLDLTLAARECKLVNELQRLTTIDEHATFAHFVAAAAYRGHTCAVFELLLQDLYSHLGDNIMPTGEIHGLPLAEIQRIAIQLFTALQAFKRVKLVHGDLKPENVMIAHSAGPTIKVIDFGNARFLPVRPGSCTQSLYYRAPEAILRCDDGFPIDVWSVGCIIMELFAGTPIFPGQNEMEMLQLMHKFLGNFPGELYDKAPRKKDFFKKTPPHGTWALRTLVCPADANALVGDSLEAVVRQYRRYDLEPTLPERDAREPLIDLLKQCFEYLPNRRITPEAALRHQFLAADLSELA
jgi:serine/threonine protein kinase